MAEVRSRVLTLVYVERGPEVQVISFRVASSVEREVYEQAQSQTDWPRVEAVKETDPIPYSPEDGPYDPNQAEESAAYLSAATIRRPGQRGKQKSATKQLVSLRLSAIVLEYFKATGPGWQRRIDEVLRKAAEQGTT